MTWRSLVLLIIGWLPMEGFTLMAQETGTIRVSLTDPFGGELKNYSLELQSVDGGVIAGGPHEREFREVPYDEYRLIARSGCCIAERRIILNVPYVWVRFGVPIRYGDSDLPGGYLVIRGSLRPLSDVSTAHWVRIRGLFLEVSREAQVKNNGTFSIDGLDMGTYVIEVFRANKLISTRTVEIDIRQDVTEVVIDLLPSL